MTSRIPTDFSSLLAALAHALAGRELPFMLIGGQAVLLHGRPRLTEDIDIEFAVVPGREAILDEMVRLRDEAGDER